MIKADRTKFWIERKRKLKSEWELMEDYMLIEKKGELKSEREWRTTCQ